MTTPTRDNWHTFCTEPALTDAERDALETLYARMEADTGLVVHVDLSTVAEQAAFDAVCIGDVGYQPLVDKQDTCRRYLRAQLAAGATYAHPEPAS